MKEVKWKCTQNSRLSVVEVNEYIIRKNMVFILCRDSIASPGSLHFQDVSHFFKNGFFLCCHDLTNVTCSLFRVYSNFYFQQCEQLTTWSQSTKAAGWICLSLFASIRHLSGHVQTWCMNSEPILHHIALASLSNSRTPDPTWIATCLSAADRKNGNSSLNLFLFFSRWFNRNFNHA